MTKQSQECACKEASCKKDCSSKHTHKQFFCDFCEPEACKKMIEQTKPQPTPDEWERRLSEVVENAADREGIVDLGSEGWKNFLTFLSTHYVKKSALIERVEGVMKPHENTPTHMKDELYCCPDCHDFGERKRILEGLPKEERPKWGSENADLYEAYANGFNQALSECKRVIEGNSKPTI